MKIRKWLKPVLCLSLMLIMLLGVFTTASADQWMNSNGRWWYRYSNGSYPKAQWKKIRNTWYYFDSAGWMVTGKQQIGDATYIFDTSGAMITGWYPLGEDWYFANGSGALVTGWQMIGGKWYYFRKDFSMVTQWATINDIAYFFGDDGAMRANQWVGNVWINADGSAAVALHVDTTPITIRVGQTVPKAVSLDGEGSVTFEIEDEDIVGCTWSRVWIDGRDTTLYVTGLEPGVTTVYVTNSITDIYYWFVVTVTW